MAVLTREWGVKGELKALPVSDKFKQIRIGQNIAVSLPDGSIKQAEIASLKKLNEEYAVSLKGVATREEAAAYRNATLSVPSDSLILSEGEYLYSQIIGLKVVASDGRPIGEVVEIMETGSNDVYVVDDGKREVLMPAIRDVIKDIDLAAGIITINLMEGLID